MHWLSRHRFWILALICAFWTGLIFLGHFFPGTPFLSVPWGGEQSFEDLLRREGRKTPTRDDFVFLGIDQSTLQLPPMTTEEIAGSRAFQLMKQRPFPWSREVWALLLDRLFGAGARLVMFDMIFSPPNDGDPAFHDTFEPRPLYEVFDPKFWHANYADGSFFKNKIVMVGSSAQVTHDVFDTPMSPETSGPALHLQAMAAALGHEFLQPTPPKTGLALVVGAGLAAWCLIVFLRRPLLCLAGLVVIAGAYLGAARFCYDKSGLLLLTVPVLSALLLSGLFSLGFEYALERLETLRTRRTLERYVSKNLVKEVLENPD